MLGRLNRQYKLVLLHYHYPLQTESSRYDIVMRKVRSKGTSRLAKFGSIACRSNYATVKLDYNKLIKFLSTHHITITAAVWKVFNIDAATYTTTINNGKQNTLRASMRKQKTKL